MIRRRLFPGTVVAVSSGLLLVAVGCDRNAALVSEPVALPSHRLHDSASADEVLAACWQTLRSGPSSQRLKALSEIDARIEQGMTKNEVLALYPPDYLVEKSRKEGGFWLYLHIVSE